MKFRVWDNTWNDWVPTQCAVNNEGRLFIEVNPGQWIDASNHAGRFVICWSASEIDDNGREIFHGDIVGVLAEGEWHKDYTRLHWVNWGSDKQWVLSEQLDRDYGIPTNWSPFKQRVVLGNIFQNRGLIDHEPVKDANGRYHDELPF